MMMMTSKGKLPGSYLYQNHYMPTSNQGNNVSFNTSLKLSNGMRTIKYLIFIFSFVFLALGIKLIVVGSILNVQFKDYLDFEGRTNISSAAIFIISFGSLVSLISFFGCTGSLRESRCMIIVFSGFLIITFFGELAIVFVGFSFKDKMFTVLQSEMVNSINLTSPGIMNTWNIIQQEFECCGFMGAEDWERNENYVPNSCCKHDFGECGSEENPAFADGCYKSLNDWTSSNLSILASIVLLVSIFQIFGTMFSCLLARNIKRGYDFVDD